MFEVKAIGNLACDAEAKTVTLKDGSKVQVVELNAYFNDLKDILGWEKTPPTRITLWDERDQKFFLQYAKTGSRIQVDGKPRIYTYLSKKTNKWEVGIEFPFPDNVKFRSFGSGKSSNNQTRISQDQNQNQNQEQTPNQVANQNEAVPEQKKEGEFQELFEGLPGMLGKAQ